MGFSEFCGSARQPIVNRRIAANIANHAVIEVRKSPSFLPEIEQQGGPDLIIIPAALVMGVSVLLEMTVSARC